GALARSSAPREMGRGADRRPLRDPDGAGDGRPRARRLRAGARRGRKAPRSAWCIRGMGALGARIRRRRRRRARRALRRVAAGRPRVRTLTAIAMQTYDAWLIDLDGTLYFQLPVRAAMAAELLLAGWGAVRVLREFRRHHEHLRKNPPDTLDPYRAQ